VTATTLGGNELPLGIAPQATIREIKVQLVAHFGDLEMEDIVLVKGAACLQDESALARDVFQDGDRITVLQVNNTCRIGAWIPGRLLAAAAAPPTFASDVEPVTCR